MFKRVLVLVATVIFGVGMLAVTPASAAPRYAPDGPCEDVDGSDGGGGADHCAPDCDTGATSGDGATTDGDGCMPVCDTHGADAGSGSDCVDGNGEEQHDCDDPGHTGDSGVSGDSPDTCVFGTVELARTGSDLSQNLGLAGGLLLGLGCVAVMGARRRARA